MFDFLIFGSNGYIGRNIKKNLKESGFSLYEANRKSKNFSDNHYLNLPRAKFCLYLAENSFLNNNDQHLIDQNFERLNSALKSTKNTKFIYFSSASVYGDGSKIPHKTNESLLPINLYTSSKIICEQLVIQNKGLVLRCSNIYGAELKEGNLFHDVIKQIKNDTIHLRNTTAVRDYLHIDDVSNFLKSVYCNWNEGIYNLGSGEGVSVSEIVQIISNSMKKNFDVISKNPATKESFLVLDIKDTVKSFNWEPKISINSGLSRFLKVI